MGECIQWNCKNRSESFADGSGLPFSYNENHPSNLSAVRHALFYGCLYDRMGLSWKAGVAAEVLANTKHSIGGNIYNAKIYIETADLFAWTAVVIVISVVLEKLMVKLMKAVGKKYNLS